MDERIRTEGKANAAENKNSIFHSRQSEPLRHMQSPAELIDFLHMTYGNQEVERLLRSGVLQAKLKVGKPDDVCEQEADRVANQVSSASQCKCTEHCLENENKLVQRTIEKPSDTESALIEDSFVQNLGSGQPLDRATRNIFEPRLGHDFSQVRVHTDSKAIESARKLNAKAYTVGKNVVFGSGEYAPGESEGKRLLAHELVHVIQQKGASLMLQRQVKGKEESVGKTPHEQPDENRFNFCFIMASDNAGKLADWFARTYFSSTHEIIHSKSLCGILESINAKVNFKAHGENRSKVGQVVIISHADKEGKLYFPLNDDNTTLWTKPDDISQTLSKNWLSRTGINCRVAASAVSNASDAKTRVIVKGCNLGQNKAAVDALRYLFGGQATITAPRKKVELRALGYGPKVKGRRTPAEVISWMVKNGYLPPEVEKWEEKKKVDFVLTLFPANKDRLAIRGIPADFLILDGKEVPPSDPRYKENVAESRP